MHVDIASSIAHLWLKTQFLLRPLLLLLLLLLLLPLPPSLCLLLLLLLLRTRAPPWRNSSSSGSGDGSKQVTKMLPRPTGRAAHHLSHLAWTAHGPAAGPHRAPRTPITPTPCGPSPAQQDTGYQP